MFSSLQDALKKLRETRQNEQSQPKRAALAPETNTQTIRPQPPAALDADGLDDLDLDDVDLFDDLIAEDTLIITETMGANSGSAPVVSPAKAVSPARSVTQVTGSRVPTHATSRPSPSTTNQTTPGTNDRQPLHQNHVVPGFESTPTNGKAPLHRLPSNSVSDQLSRQGSTESQTDMFTTPRRDTNRKTVTTVVGKRSHRTPTVGPKRQRIPGPAGLVDSAEPVAAATQKRASPFKTPLSRRMYNEQADSVDFEGGTWAAMLDHLKLPSYTPATAKSVVRANGAAEWPIRRVLEASHTQRVRIMLVQLRDMGSSDSDACVSVADPTGEMRASIHRPVMKRFLHFLAAGTSIILKDVVALKLPGAPPYLVITAASIEQIFTSKGAGTSENPIVLSATQGPGTPTHAPTKCPESGAQPASQHVSEISSQSPQPQTSTPAAKDSDDLLGDFLDNDDEDSAFIDMLDSSQ
ncbi:hypothetical protein IWW35_002230 [Coemansia sp. RSA 1878]|nr:hypothetical protein IWW35_002230 [Coemansia sp. RSA 1878]